MIKWLHWVSTLYQLLFIYTFFIVYVKEHKKTFVKKMIIRIVCNKFQLSYYETTYLVIVFGNTTQLSDNQRIRKEKKRGRLLFPSV